MDHLLDFGKSVPIRVPYFCREMFDCGDFAGYPGRKGWTISELVERNTQNHDQGELAGFLQAWAYFGLLYSIFQPTNSAFDLFEFVEEDEQGERVTTKELPKHVHRWRQWESTRTPQQRQERFNLIRSYFQVLIRVIPLSYSYDSDPNQTLSAPWPGPPELTLSAVVLADSLTWAGSQALGKAFSLDWGVHILLIERMRVAGWCPSVTATLLKGQQLQNLYSASTIGPPLIIQDHTGRGCTENLCHFDQLHEANYKPEHCADCPGCEKIGPLMETVRQIISSGGIPVVAYKVTSTGESLDVKNAGGQLPYVAISHVWSHGLGNPDENKLPLCQVKRLQALVDSVSLPPGQPRLLPHHWWCDTLCVPIRADDDELRKLAIKNMRTTYQESSKVLAIDSTLVKISCNTPVIELYIRLKLSTWMRRLWTFQEAIIPQEIHIAFSDGFRTMQNVAASLQQEEGESLAWFYRRYGLLSRTFFGPFVNRTQGDIINRFNSAWKQIQWRSTSHEADETVCLATILGLDPTPLLDIPPRDWERRMVTLLRMMGSFPMLFPFQPPPRLQTPGFSWAPASFLNCFRDTATNPFRNLGGRATLGPNNEALLLGTSGLVFNQESNPAFAGPDDFHIAVTGQPNPSHSVTYRWGADRAAMNGRTGAGLEAPALVYLATDDSTNPAVLVNVLETDSTSGFIKVAYIAVMFVGPVARFPDGTTRGGVVYQATERPQSQKWLLY